MEHGTLDLKDQPVTFYHLPKNYGKVYVRIFPHLAKTKKPAEVRMGSGKGNPEFWVAVVKTGRVMFEMSGVPEADAREALRLAAYKLPCRCKVIAKEAK